MKISKLRLGDIAQTASGGTPSRGNNLYYSGDIPWIKSGELVDGPISFVSEKITLEGLKNSSAKIFPKGTLLMAMYGATVGKLGILEFDACTNQAVCAILPDMSLDKEYLFYYLLSIRSELLKSSFGGAQPNISQTVINDLLIPIPNLGVQKSISKKLSISFAQIQKAKAAAEAKKADLKVLLLKQQEVAMAMLDGLPREPLSKFINGIEAGKSIKTTELLAKKDELGVLKVSAVSWDEFKSNEAKSVWEGYVPKEMHKVKKGDFIISRANTKEFVGAVVIADDNYPNRLLSDKTLRLLVKNEMVSSEFLLHILKLPEARKFIEENATGSSSSMLNISQGTIYKIPIPVANEKIQKEVVRIMSQSKEEIKRAEEALNNILSDLKLLPKKILDDAFNING